MLIPPLRSMKGLAVTTGPKTRRANAQRLLHFGNSRDGLIIKRIKVASRGHGDDQTLGASQVSQQTENDDRRKPGKSSRPQELQRRPETETPKQQKRAFAHGISHDMTIDRYQIDKKACKPSSRRADEFDGDKVNRDDGKYAGDDGGELRGHLPVMRTMASQ